MSVPAQSILAGLNERQTQAVTALEGPVLIVAGPGSGKTTVLTRRLAALLDAGVPAHRILAVTFTNKAANLMRERLLDLVPVGAERVRVSTFHSACVRILRAHHEHAGLPSSFSIADKSASAGVMRAAASKARLLEGLGKQEVTDMIKMLTSGVSAAKNAGMTPEQLAHHSGDSALIAAAWSGYDAALRAADTVDFDDLLVLATRLTREHSPVRESITRRYDYILVDEYQDTNLIQEELMLALARSGNVCVVGDPDQSIYAFRGATPNVMARFTQHYPHAQVVVLDTNYRSTGNICAVSAAVIAQNPQALRAVSQPVTGAGEQVWVRSFADGDAEAAWAAQRIAATGEYGQHAILMRSLATSRSVERELRARGIPYVLSGGVTFFDRAEIKDALSWLHLATNPRDVYAFARACSAPKRGIGATSVEKVAAHLEQYPHGTVREACVYLSQSAGRSSVAFTAFLADLDEVTRYAGESMYAALSFVANDVGLRAALASSDARHATDRAQALDELLDDAQTFDVRSENAGVTGRERLVAYSERACLYASTDTDVGTHVVSVMTIHAAKGTEFDHVHVIGVEENLLPHARAIASGSENDIAEERRLMFVATSRARKTLALSMCHSRFFFGTVTHNEPSRFLQALPSQAITRTQPLTELTRAAGTAPAQIVTRAGPGRRVAEAGPAPVFVTGSRVVHTIFGAGIVAHTDGGVAVLFDADGATRLLDPAIAPMRSVT